MVRKSDGFEPFSAYFETPSNTNFSSISSSQPFQPRSSLKPGSRDKSAKSKSYFSISGLTRLLAHPAKGRGGRRPRAPKRGEQFQVADEGPALERRAQRYLLAEERRGAEPQVALAHGREFAHSERLLHRPEGAGGNPGPRARARGATSLGTEAALEEQPVLGAPARAAGGKEKRLGVRGERLRQ